MASEASKSCIRTATSWQATFVQAGTAQSHSIDGFGCLSMIRLLVTRGVQPRQGAVTGASRPPLSRSRCFRRLLKPPRRRATLQRGSRPLSSTSEPMNRAAVPRGPSC